MSWKDFLIERRDAIRDQVIGLQGRIQEIDSLIQQADPVEKATKPIDPKPSVERKPRSGATPARNSAGQTRNDVILLALKRAGAAGMTYKEVHAALSRNGFDVKLAVASALVSILKGKGSVTYSNGRYSLKATP